jgi:hypothetical protein
MSIKLLAVPAILAATLQNPMTLAAPLTTSVDSLGHSSQRSNAGLFRGLGIDPFLCDSDSLLVTENTDVNTITEGLSVSCFTNDGTYGHSYGRYHDLGSLADGDYAVQCVHWGLEYSDLALDVTINIYRDVDGIDVPGSSSGDLQLLGSLGGDGSITFPANQTTPTYVTAEFDGSISVSSDDLLFIEIVVPSGIDDNGKHFIGANSIGQSSDSWIITENGQCGINSWFTTAQIGYPDVHWVQAIELIGAAPTDPCLDALPMTCPADVSGSNGQPDDEINVTDLLAVIANWNQSGDGTERPLGDCAPMPNGDCVVDVSDLLAVIGAWGNTDCVEQTTGACCVLSKTCEDNVTQADCMSTGGNIWYGNQTCGNVPCGPDVDLALNEIRTNEPGSDFNEYIELSGIGGSSLDNYSFIAIGDGATGDFGVIETSLTLTGFSLPADGTFVIAEETFTLGTADVVTELNFENSDQITYMLVYGFTGFTGDDLDTDDDGVLDVEPWQFIKDSVAFIGPNPADGDPIYSSVTVGPDVEYVPVHAYRCPDGGGDWVVGCYELIGDTPGAANDCTSGDSDGDGVSDTCDNCPNLANPDQADCDGDGAGDACELADGTASDCNDNGIPDNCETDCNENGLADECELADGTADDCDGNGIPDDCQEDCNLNGLTDACEILDNPDLDQNGNGVIDTCETPLFVINEIHADPSNSNEYADGDANGDGVGSFSEDEFVEIANRSGAAIDMSGWTLSDAVGTRHVFPNGTVLDDQCVIVIFGGGNPIGDFGGALVQTASTGFLGLNNGGDTVSVFDSAGALQLEVVYGGEGGDNQSITLVPDVYGETFSKHSEVSSDGSLWSPGLRIDGQPLGTCTAPVDSDGDGVPDEFDNCVDLPNNNQADCDNDGIGDVCELADGTQLDDNGNGIPDDCEGDTPTTLWINEFHYDNASSDVGEFVEVVLLDGVNPSQVTLSLYNGNGGVVYSSHNVGTEFTPGESGNGYTVYWLEFEPNGIQNGPDGFCLDLGGQVAQFISYEGTLEATDGPASGLLSVDVLLIENSGTLVGSSIGLTGTSGEAAGFAWTELVELDSPGNSNDGQFITP